MRNVETSVTGDILTIKINLKATPKASASGKSNVIGSTEGNVSVPGFPEVKLGVNCYTGK
jgi:flagellar basal body L-ring protein FlgH